MPTAAKTVRCPTTFVMAPAGPYARDAFVWRTVFPFTGIDIRGERLFLRILRPHTRVVRRLTAGVHGKPLVMASTRPTVRQCVGLRLTFNQLEDCRIRFRMVRRCSSARMTFSRVEVVIVHRAADDVPAAAGQANGRRGYVSCPDQMQHALIDVQILTDRCASSCRLSPQR